ncbi:hypothetical protein AB7008_09590 [Bradyrhizobium sp. 521_C7_N1_3]|uniref:hypothetical protein n=1 Tax=Bradyrhizobium sp. 521_C7_N1_3 TaxID=3240368 RepID=UPI003F8A11BC
MKSATTAIYTSRSIRTIWRWKLEELETSIESIKRVIGLAPVGYRAPSGEMSAKLIRLLTERGFIYDSTMLDDIESNRHILEDGSPAVVVAVALEHG